MNWLAVTIQWPSGLKLPGVDREEVADQDVQRDGRCGCSRCAGVVGAHGDELEAVRRVLRVVDELRGGRSACGGASRSMRPRAARSCPSSSRRRGRPARGPRAARCVWIVLTSCARVGVDAQRRSACGRGSGRRRPRARGPDRRRGASGMPAVELRRIVPSAPSRSSSVPSGAIASAVTPSSVFGSRGLRRGTWPRCPACVGDARTVLAPGRRRHDRRAHRQRREHMAGRS